MQVARETFVKSKIRGSFCTLNHFHNILRLFDVLPNFSFTTSETIRDYYLLLLISMVY